MTPDIMLIEPQQASLTTAFVMFVISLAITVAIEFLRPSPDLEDARPKGLGDFNFPTATEDRFVPILFGTMDIKGPNVIWYGDLRTTPVRETVRTGLFRSERIDIAVRYFVGVQIALCYGPIDRVSRFVVDDKEVPGFTALDPASTDAGVTFVFRDDNFFGGKAKGGGLAGTWRFFGGTSTQDKPTYLTGLLGVNVPVYREIAHVVGERPFVGETPRVSPWVFRCSRFPNNLGLTGNGHIIRGDIEEGDANPAEVAYELLTSELFGLGLPLSRVNTQSFIDAGETLATEENGWSSLQDSPIRASELIREVMRQIDGTLYEDQNGQFAMRLFRSDYVLGDTPIFDESNVRNVTSFTRVAWGQTQNDVSLSFVDRTRNYVSTASPAQDTANVLIQGKQIRANVTFPGIKHPTTASQVAARELRVLSYPVAQVKFEANREAASLIPGDVVRLTWPRLDLVEFPVRVMNVELGELEDGTVLITGSEDFWQEAPDATIMGVPDDTQWEEIDTSALPPTATFIAEVPRWVSFNNAAEGQNRANPEFAQLWAAAVPGNQIQTGWALFTGMGVILRGSIDFRNYSPTGFLSQDYPADTPAIDNTGSLTINGTAGVGAGDGSSLETILEDTDASGVAAGLNLAVIVSGGSGVDEFIGWETIVDNGSGNFTLNNVHRGLMDTVPRDHLVGDQLYFLDLAGISIESYNDSDLIDYQFQTLYFISLQGSSPQFTSAAGDLSSGPIESFQFEERQVRPLPPRNWSVDDGGPAERVARLTAGDVLDISGGGTLTFTWLHQIFDSNIQRDCDDGSAVDADQDQEVEYDLDLEGAWSTIDFVNITRTNAANWRNFTWTEAQAQLDTGEAGVIPIRATLRARRDPLATSHPNLQALQQQQSIFALDVGGATLQSIDLDGSTEYLADITPTPFGVSDNFTVNAWARPTIDVGGSERSLISVSATGNDFNRIDLRLSDDSDGSPWLVRLYSSTGVLFKEYEFGSYTSGAWSMITITWNGTSLLCYENGAISVPSATPVDNAGTMVESFRGVYVGTDRTALVRWPGLVHKITAWSTALLGAEITEIYNSGSGSTFNELIPGTNYQSHAQARHHWDFRQSGATTLGQDYGARIASARYNLTDNALNVDATDLVATVP